MFAIYILESLFLSNVNDPPSLSDTFYTVIINK